jgi:hypothetical protein
MMLTSEQSSATVLITSMPNHGGWRPGAGRKSIFAAKAVQKPFSVAMTPAGLRALRALTIRTGLSRNSVVAVLALQHADDVRFEGPGVVFVGKSTYRDSIRVPPEAAKKLRAAHRRTQKKR